MRVLQISKFYPPVRGGIESAAFELTEGLNLAGLHTDVLCANTRASTCSEQTPTGYQVMRAASFGRLLSTSMSPMLALQTRRLVSHYDVVHVHMPDPMAALSLLLAQPQAPLVVHWHSDVIRQRLSLRLYEPLQQWLLQRADAIVATSQRYLESSEVLRPWAHKAHVIPIGISDNHGRARPERVAAIRQRFASKRLVFALGRMTYYKGFDVLIEAAARLPDDIAVMIGGDGELASDLRAQIAARGLGHKVELLGHIDHDDLTDYFEACDVFCLPSTARSEAYGIAMVEAMSMGKPVVSAAIDGSGVQWVNDAGVTGLSVPVGSADALADALRRVLDDLALRQRLAGAGRHRYLQELSAGAMIEKTIALYHRLARAA